MSIYEPPAIMAMQQTGRGITSNFAPPPEPTTSWVDQLWRVLRLKDEAKSATEIAQAAGIPEQSLPKLLRQNCRYALDHRASVETHLCNHLSLSPVEAERFWKLASQEIPT